MLPLARHQELCRQFAGLFAYPHAGLPAEAAACAGALATLSPVLARPVEHFAAHAATRRPEQLEEEYTAAFELQALCQPYVGYQLCGETQQRTVFMLRLCELYRQHGFTPGNELPDHLGELLRFIGTVVAPDCREELINDGLLPAIDKCLAESAEATSPYLELLRGLRGFLAGTTAADRPTEDRS